MVEDTDVYKPRNPKRGDYYRCIEAHFEELMAVWDERFSAAYGYRRPYALEVVYRYLDCGDLHCGFARVKCRDCNHEYLLPLSCKRRHFCPSCHQKRVVVFGEELCQKVLKSVPHRQWVFSIPRRLRKFFMYDRKLLADLSRCAWKVLDRYLKALAPGGKAGCGAVVAVQTFGDFQNFNPHLHVIATDGCFYGGGNFLVGPPRPSGKELADAYRHEVFTMLKKRGRITDAVISSMMKWRYHSGFSVYCGEAVWPHNSLGLENLARYIIRASFSQERMTYLPAHQSESGCAKVLYRSKCGTKIQVIDALDWLARLLVHIPNRGEQMVWLLQ